MDITRVTCNGCGAALEVSPQARFATCRYCAARLEIRHTESAVFTEVLHHIDKNTAGMAEDLEAIRKEHEIERLDREWQLRKESLLSHGRDGSTSEPSVAGGVILMLVCGGFSLYWTITAFTMIYRSRSRVESFPVGFSPEMTSHSPSGFDGLDLCFPVFGILGLIASVVGGIWLMNKAGTYKQEEEHYLRKRAALTGTADPTVNPRDVQALNALQHQRVDSED